MPNMLLNLKKTAMGLQDKQQYCNNGYRIIYGYYLS